jgi:hypothetical protein
MTNNNKAITITIVTTNTNNNKMIKHLTNSFSMFIASNYWILVNNELAGIRGEVRVSCMGVVLIQNSLEEKQQVTKI